MRYFKEGKPTFGFVLYFLWLLPLRTKSFAFCWNFELIFVLENFFYRKLSGLVRRCSNKRDFNQFRAGIQSAKGLFTSFRHHTIICRPPLNLSRTSPNTSTNTAHRAVFCHQSSFIVLVVVNCELWCNGDTRDKEFNSLAPCTRPKKIKM